MTKAKQHDGNRSDDTAVAPIADDSVDGSRRGGSPDRGPRQTRLVFPRLVLAALVAGLAPGVVRDAAAQSPAIELSETALAVDEGSSVSYTVQLATQPSADVTVTIGGTSGTDLTVVPSSATLTFTADNWSTAQTVSVRASADADATHDSATLTHTGSGGGYGSVMANLPVTVNDTTRVPLTAVVRNVPEGTTMPITATIPTPLDEDVSIAVTVAPNGGRADEYTLSTNTTLMIAAGAKESTGEVIFTSLDDFVWTGGRYFTATLTPDHARVEAYSEDFQVLDDDRNNTVMQISQSTIFENGGEATLLAYKTRLHEHRVTMSLSAEPAERVMLSGDTLTFEPGASYATESPTITAVDNALDDGNQTVTISATVTEGRGIRTPRPLVLTIADDEGASAQVQLRLSPPRVREGRVSTVTAVASHPLGPRRRSRCPRRRVTTRRWRATTC